MASKGNVLMAMSGGVDSSVAALLLLEKGYNLVGITMKTWDYAASGGTAKETGCCSLDSINDARAVAVKYGFPHYVLDLRQEFENKIIPNFIEEYISGSTPNPCVLCNKLVKWDDLLKKADQLDCEYIATGHYSNVIEQNSRYFLRKGKDETKDQTYVLWGLTQEHLRRTIFPLGDLYKTEVKEMAKKAGLSRLASKSESFEICFIPDNDYRGFLKNRKPELQTQVEGGDFIDNEGKVLGTHHGYPFYTIGQRKGLEIALGEPMYVNEINADNNTVRLGKKESLLATSLIAKSLNLMKYPDFTVLEKVLTKIRYKDKGTLSRLEKTDDVITVFFDEPASAITPGQSVVFYEGDDLIGGGVIV